MCGICGFTGSIKGANEIIKKMNDSIMHRGPDEDGYYHDGSVNLGIRRLSIIDVETGHQPTHNEDNNIWSIFNGEIYNFLDLRKELKDKGHHLYTDHSDTEVITHLYEEYGAGFLNKINGMFAVALWDKKKEMLILARDRMGVKPLFYSIVDGDLVFASEIKAILKYPKYGREINYSAVYHYFTFKNIPSPMTAFKGINSLLPGEMVTFSKGSVSNNRWWKARFEEKNVYDAKYLEERILSILEDATRIRMISDVPFGAYLSGGVDSSSIVALMTKYSGKPVKTFSMGYEGELKNKEADLHYARKIARLYKTEHYEYIMSHKELVEDVANVIEAFDQPFSGTISTFFLTKLIKKHVKVALSGDGADELFGSYLSHRVAQPMHHFGRLRDKVAARALSSDEKRLFEPCSMDFLEDLFERSGGEEARWRYNLYLFSDEEKKSLLSADFLGHIKDKGSFELINRYFDGLSATDPLNRVLEMEWNTQLPDQVLAFVDFLSMAHSVEIRSPFLDYRLVEFVAAIPGNMKIRNGNVKDILKESVSGLIPEEITRRPKEGFVLPVFDWMKQELREYSVSVLSENRLNKYGLLNAGKVNEMLKRYYAGEKAVAGRIWNLMMFQVWLEKYFG